ncbi:MAG: ECF-type sigma factor, partial [Planctomycetota bacterium]
MLRSAAVIEPSPELTSILRDLAGGRRDRVDRLLDALYEDLRGLAARHLQGERKDHTLQPTALVHEAWLRLIDQRSVEWRDRS